MYEIKRKEVELPDGVTITTFNCEIFGVNVMSVEAGTTGYCGGDTGHGGRTYFKIMDEGGTDITVNKLRSIGKGGFEVLLGGDAELDTIIDALEFILQVLRDGRDGKNF